MVEVKDATISVESHLVADRLSFLAKDGQLTCITGPEGCGKTTLLRVLMGFLPVKAGYVSVDGELLTVFSAHAFRRLMVYLPQQVELLTHQLVPPEAQPAEEEPYGVWNSLLPQAVRFKRPETLPAEQIFQLEQQILSQSHEKQIVMADEPTAHLTDELAERVLALLRQQADAGKTVLIASRRQQIINRADQVIALQSSNQ